ncbi:MULTISPECIES: HNH endonuclease family protein [unclassified Sphingomonas]|uniref:HNH endonuclease family protein n=1 Tax=unclassified Sphingomonas TaxID=196159 RepID=UPI000E107901|nr:MULTISPECIES: HNH endonuclease family protein [unclassified Sphingomonas]AXJ96338.1 hypothetical protein DM480_13395 [Sphingomonas sp. FARSPH]
MGSAADVARRDARSQTERRGPCRQGEGRSECIDEFGDFSGNWTQRLGNLTLVEQDINSSLGNRPFSTKRQFYGQSQLLLTRAIAEKTSAGVNTRISAAVADLESFFRWTPEEIETRQMQLATLAAAVWDVPAPAPGSSLAPPVAEAI